MKQIKQKLVDLQKKLKSIKPNVQNTYFGNQYADLSAIADYLYPLMTEVGLCVTHYTEVKDNYVFLVTLISSDDEQLQSTWPLGPSTGNQQQLGSALTYGKRYTLQSLVGLAVHGEDDDAETAMNRKSQSKPTQKVQAKPKTYAPSTLPNNEIPNFDPPGSVESLKMFGKKYQGKTVGDIGIDKAKDYVNWLKSTNPKGQAAHFVQEFESML